MNFLSFLEVETQTESDVTRHGVSATVVDDELIHLDVGLRVNLAVDFTLPSGSRQVTIVVSITSGAIHAHDILRVQQVQHLEIDVHVGVAALRTFLLATHREVEVLVNTEVETEGGRNSGTVVGTLQQVVTTRDR